MHKPLSTFYFHRDLIFDKNSLVIQNLYFCMCISTGMGIDGHPLDGDFVGHGQSRTKRMRTSFKHHQLRTMKSYFSINHNPDAKDLKQLAQKTGLTKRVLQVRRRC